MKTDHETISRLYPETIGWAASTGGSTQICTPNRNPATIFKNRHLPALLSGPYRPPYWVGGGSCPPLCGLNSVLSGGSTWTPRTNPNWSSRGTPEYPRIGTRSGSLALADTVSSRIRIPWMTPPRRQFHVYPPQDDPDRLRELRDWVGARGSYQFHRGRPRGWIPGFGSSPADRVCL
jgi:hypothetical protein